MYASSGKWMGVLLMLWSLIQPVWAEDAVAMVTDVKGQVTSNVQGNSEKLGLLSYLSPNAELRLESGARVVVTYFSKPQECVFVGPARVRIAPDGPIVLSGGAAEMRKLGQQQAGAAKRFSSMQRERLVQATFEMRALKAGVRLLGPVETPVLDSEPEFLWSGPSNAGRYHFTLFAQDGRVLQDLQLPEAHLKLSGASPLARGQGYSWKVEATLPSGETLAASGRFSVLDESAAQRLLAARPAPGAEFSVRVLYAALLEAEGLKHDAAQAWQALAQERPDDPSLQERATR